MSRSEYPSRVNLPQKNAGWATVLDFLIGHFPAISPAVWRQRMLDGNVHWRDGSLIQADTPFRTQQQVHYYREVVMEPIIPFDETILYQDDLLLLADKPHFLPVTPGGIYVNECLQNRLRDKTGNPHLQALHRIDRETAGLVLFSVDPEKRAAYHELFSQRQIHKTYYAIASLPDSSAISGQEWNVSTRITQCKSSFLMQVVEGEANSRSVIRCVAQRSNKGLFELHPVSGRKHQLRVHMQSLGWPILHDRFYPVLQPKMADNYAEPLQLLAKKLEFIDPVTLERRQFVSKRSLRW